MGIGVTFHNFRWPSVQSQEGVAISSLARLRCSWGLCLLLQLLLRAGWNRSRTREGNAFLDCRTFPLLATENHKNTETWRGEMFYLVTHSGL